MIRLGLVTLAILALAIGCTTTEPAPRQVVTSTPVPTPLPTATAEPGDSEPARTTIDELLDTPFPLNIAHAGGDLMSPHSTLFAYSEAVDAGATVLELDVQLTADGELIVQHDDTVDKTTELTGPVDELTLAEIQVLDNAYWFSPECWPCQDLEEDAYVWRGVRTGDRPPPAGYTPEDFRVPTLREVAERFPTMPLDIEIKGGYPQGFATAATLAAEIEALDLADSVIVVSFDDGVLSVFEQLAPGIATSPGVGELTNWFLLDEPLQGEHRIIQVPPEFDGVPVLTDLFWEKVDRDDLSVWVWPNDQSQENLTFYQGLISQGADGVIAGRPNEMAAATA